MDEKQEYKLEVVISGIDKTEMESIFELLVGLVDIVKGSIAGGFAVYKDDPDQDDES